MGSPTFLVFYKARSTKDQSRCGAHISLGEYPMVERLPSEETSLQLGCSRAEDKRAAIIEQRAARVQASELASKDIPNSKRARREV
jgi:hypothetical protein